MSYYIIYEKLSDVIYPQCLQLFNLYLVKNVNTEDRVKDGIIVVIINGIIVIILNLLYNFTIKIYNYLKINENNDEIIVEDVIKLYSINQIREYESNFKLIDDNINHSILCTNSVMWIIIYLKDNKCINKILPNNKTKLSLINTYSDDEKCYKYLIKNYEHIYTPVYKYFNKNLKIYEYIFLYESTLYSKDINELENFLMLVKNYYNNKNIKDDVNILSVYEYINSANSFITRKICKINKEFSFNCIFFKDKPLLIKWLDKFKNCDIYPKKLCMTNKIGILLYGPPGTGKTSCITAIANYLNKNVIMINSLKLFGDDIDIFKQFINNKKKDNILVFDEFDYIFNENQNQNDIEMTNFKDIDEHMNYLKNKDKKIDLSFMLKLFDGLNGDNDERVIIATTNNPDKINKLLLRPGRFDLKLKLSYCDYDMFISIVKTKFDISIDKENLTEILKKNITPVILINKLVESNSVDELLNLLNELEQSNYDLII